MRLNNQSLISAVRWGVAGLIFAALGLYVLQALGMQDIYGPFYFFQAKWYFILPLIFGFGLQLGLFRAIRLKARQGMAALAASGGVSGGSMVACCSHNLVSFVPFLGLSGLAGFLSVYQDYIFGLSILFVIGGTIYMWRQYKKVHSRCQ